MSTNSTIAIEREDGTVAQIYAHWDGYIDHNGKILRDHYRSPEKIEQLIALGNVSILSEEIGERHEFTQGRVKWSTFYGRDRGDSGMGAQVFKNWDDYLQNGDQQEYNYIFRKGQWLVQCDYLGDGKFYALSDAFEIQSMEEE